MEVFLHGMSKTIIVDQRPDLVIVNANLPDTILFVLALQTAKLPVIALVNADDMHDRLRLTQIPVVDKRRSFVEAEFDPFACC